MQTFYDTVFVYRQKELNLIYFFLPSFKTNKWDVQAHSNNH